MLTLNFGSAELTKPLPDCGTQAFWCILWSVQLLHGLQQKLQLVRRWGAACLRLFGNTGAALCLYLCPKSPETFKIISNKGNRILVNAKNNLNKQTKNRIQQNSISNTNLGLRLNSLYRLLIAFFGTSWNSFLKSLSRTLKTTDIILHTVS